MIEENSNIVAPTNSTDEIKYEETIRPHVLKEFVGQKDLKENLSIFIQAANERQESLEHILFYGPPGLGKTTLSMIISQEIGSKLHTSSGPIIEKSGDLAAILTNLEPFDVLFIDEIHRMKSNIEEVLYSAMEDGVLDIMIGKGPTAKSMRIDIAPFTLVGATTKLSSVSAPLRDRFGSVMKLAFYNDDEMAKIVQRSARILEINIDDKASFELGKRSRGTPRITNRLLRRIRDFAQVGKIKNIDTNFVLRGLERLHIDKEGLNKQDRDLLLTIWEKFQGGPVGVSTLAASLSEEDSTIEEVYEPFLMQIGFLQRTPRGRVITERGKKYLQKYVEINVKDEKLF